MNENKIKPAEYAQLSIIAFIEDMVVRTRDCEEIVLYGLISQYIAAMFMKRPELMYKIFLELGTLDGTELWLDEELDQLEALYENSN